MPGTSGLGFGSGFLNGFAAVLAQKKQREQQLQDRQQQHALEAAKFLMDSGQVSNIADLEPILGVALPDVMGQGAKAKKGQPDPRAAITNILGQALQKPLPTGPAATPTQPQPTTNPANWGNRADGSAKGNGFLGPLQRPDGTVSSELSMGTTDVNGQETEIPLLVPTLSPVEVRYLLNTPAGNGDWQNPVMKGISQKAVAFAKQRQAAGKPFFAGAGEANPNLYPEFQRATVSSEPPPLTSRPNVGPGAQPQPRTLFGIPLMSPEEAAAKRVSQQVAQEGAVTTAKIDLARNRILPALRAVDPTATLDDAMAAVGVKLPSGIPNFSIVSGTDEQGNPVNMKLEHRTGALTPVQGFAPKPSATAGTKTGSFGEYLQDYAKENGLELNKLTTDDIDKARKKFAASSVSATVKAGTFGDFLDKVAADKGVKVGDLTTDDVLAARKSFAASQATGTAEARNAAELNKPIGTTAGQQYNLPPTTPLKDLAGKPGITEAEKNKISALADADQSITDIETLIKDVFPNVKPGVLGALHTKFALGMKRLGANADLADLDTAIGLTAINIGRLAGETGRVPVAIVNEMKRDLADIHPSLFNGSNQAAALAKLARVKKTLETIRANAAGANAAPAASTVPGAIMRDGHLFINGKQID